MDTGREHEVEAVFVRWLEGAGWEVTTQRDYADVVAERAGERLVAEAKGITSSAGTDLDTLYGQLLRRMTPSDDVTRYAVVVPDRLIPVALRVPAVVREQLNIRVYGVAMDDTVTEHS